MSTSNTSQDEPKALRVINAEDLYYDKQRQLKRAGKGNTMTFRVNNDTKMSALMIAFCERQGLPRAAVKFMFGGCSIKDSDNVKSLCMLDQDVISVGHADAWNIVPPPRVGNDMRDLYESIGNSAPLLADTDLDVGGSSSDLGSSPGDCTFLLGPHEVELKAHRAILAARSPKLRAMFNWQAQNGLTNFELKIPNHSPFVFDLMLEFIYSGEFNSAKCENEFARLTAQHAGGVASANRYQQQYNLGGAGQSSGKRSAPDAGLASQSGGSGQGGGTYSRKRARLANSRDIELVSSGDRPQSAPMATGTRIGGGFRIAHAYPFHAGVSAVSGGSPSSGSARRSAIGFGSLDSPRAQVQGPEQPQIEGQSSNSSSSSSSSQSPQQKQQKEGQPDSSKSAQQQQQAAQQSLGPNTLGTPELSCDLPLSLLVVADEYLLPRLKKLIEHYLMQNVNGVRQAVTCFCAADRFGAKHLKSCMQQWLLDNFDRVNQNEAARSELQRCPDLLYELTQKAVGALRNRDQQRAQRR